MLRVDSERQILMSFTLKKEFSNELFFLVAKEACFSLVLDRILRKRGKIKAGDYYFEI